MRVFSHVQRWFWPALSVLCGAVMGAILTAPPAPSKSPTQKIIGPERTAHEPTKPPAINPQPNSQKTSSADAAWPAAVVRQMADARYLNHASTVWLPAEFAERYRWNPGKIAGGSRLSPEAKKILDLDDEEVVRVEAALDRFVAEIKEIERRYSQVLEKTAKTISVRVPAGLTANGPMQKLEAELLPIVGPVGFRSLYARVISHLENISAVMSGQQFEIQSTLLDGDRVETRILRGNTARSTFSVFSEHHAHLLPPIVGTGEGRRWE